MPFLKFFPQFLWCPLPGFLSDYFLSLHWLLSLHLPFQLGSSQALPLLELHAYPRSYNDAKTSTTIYALFPSSSSLPIISPLSSTSVFSVVHWTSQLNVPHKFKNNMPIIKLKALPIPLVYSSSISVPMNRATAFLAHTGSWVNYKKSPFPRLVQPYTRLDNGTQRL